MSKILLNISSTIPIFFSLGLMGIVKYSEDYFDAWKQLGCNLEIPCTFLWWYVNVSIIVTILSIFFIAKFLRKQSQLTNEAITIEAVSYRNLNQADPNYHFKLLL